MCGRAPICITGIIPLARSGIVINILFAVASKSAGGTQRRFLAPITKSPSNPSGIGIKRQTHQIAISQWRKGSLSPTTKDLVNDAKGYICFN
jgi:hypothetical protein